ncbi:ribonuclease P protein component [Pseudomonas sp. 09C 129]|uniref:Ribonuclease P protein component n=1 Tax=Pseudomonas chlororaphis TaxID=587753 RepID=A0AB34BYL2_9PSED|nr:ribonuclease P protein component [Pseudomonas sp. 09C 129]KAA5836727.1 ribonuclease P protein component [Pseudomonas chlororaphis]ORM47975.1 ribonuclease P protein component [Pseudomonas chlororaphis subsp. chlororaphis]PMY42067.1 ribonuclease P protein component [Pseudomonas sp. GW456-L14]PMY58798.1 ribonuclease P protein component [Pseudomonas sp. GW456-L12]PMY68461.1 ribonuclease P protein component [Pseudomonas sp. FW305-25]PMY73930.1 ribonuclease P protein component [Pseudomonas sp. F
MPSCRVVAPKVVRVWQFDTPALEVSQDFSREKRLLTPRHFKAVFDSPTGKVPGKNLLLLARNNDLDHPRLGLVIGKKSVKLSVERNRLKRLMRESFRLHQDALVGWDIVIVARKGLGDVENPELIQHFDKLWKRLARNKPAPAAKPETVGVDSPNA